MGSNMAENHPVGFQWVMEARERGATLIHVDPRFTRTSAVSNVHVPRAEKRLEAVQDRFEGAQLYGTDTGDGVGGTGSMFLLLDKPEVYGLPPDPIVPTKDLPQMWKAAGVGAALLVSACVVASVVRA